MVYNAYSWDANGNLTQWDDRQSNTYDLRLTYDQLDRVDNYRNFSNTLLGDMNYDPMGNITKFDSVVGSAIHYTYNDLHHYLVKSAGYAQAWAEQREKRGKKSSILEGMLHAVACFLKMYVFKAGFLDGKQGFLLSVLSAHSTLVKYADLWIRTSTEKPKD